jgi:hypothetical protein
MEATRYGLVHRGRASSDSFSDKELQALNISMTTRMDNDIVLARLAASPVNMLQPIVGNAEEHWWKLV